MASLPTENEQSSDATTKMKQFASQMKNSTVKNAKIVSEKSKERLSLEGQLKQARISLQRFVNPKIFNKQINQETVIPKWVLKKAKGIVFLTVIKAGFLFAGAVGTGVVIVRKPNGGWSGPSSIGMGGLSFGFLGGASKIDYIMILPNDKAVKQFTGKGQFRLGGELQVAVGPVGRDMDGSIGAGDGGLSVIYSYSHAQGLYVGVGLDGKIISVRPECNRAYYQKNSVTNKEILNAKINPPSNEDYDMIVHLLDSYCLDDNFNSMKGEKNILLNEEDQKSDVKEGNMDQNNQNNQNNMNNNNNNSNVLFNGFQSFRRSFSKKFQEITSLNDNNNNNNNNNNNANQTPGNNNQINQK